MAFVIFPYCRNRIGQHAFKDVTLCVNQEFLERIPIVRFPARCETLRVAFREAGMIKYDFGFAALFHEFELHNRVDAE